MRGGRIAQFWTFRPGISGTRHGIRYRPPIPRLPDAANRSPTEANRSSRPICPSRLPQFTSILLGNRLLRPPTWTPCAPEHMYFRSTVANRMPTARTARQPRGQVRHHADIVRPLPYAIQQAATSILLVGQQLPTLTTSDGGSEHMCGEHFLRTLWICNAQTANRPPTDRQPRGQRPTLRGQFCDFASFTVSSADVVAITSDDAYLDGTSPYALRSAHTRSLHSHTHGRWLGAWVRARNTAKRGSTADISYFAYLYLLLPVTLQANRSP